MFSCQRGPRITTFICDRLHFNLATVSLLYMTVVMLLSRIGGLVSSIVTSIVAALCLAYAAPPAHSFRVDDPFDYVAITAFLVASLNVSALVSKARKRAEQDTYLLRQEIAHVWRVSMMGQLASTLAHEIKMGSAGRFPATALLSTTSITSSIPFSLPSPTASGWACRFRGQLLRRMVGGSG
jgi:K+-sensing histidine kinase KdpD